jgi:heme exporter protein C
VFAVFAGAFVPINFMAVRFAQRATTHPRVLGQADSMPLSMGVTFLLCLLAMTVLFVTLCKYELASKHATIQLRALRRRLAGDDDAVVALPRSAAPQEL